MIYLLPLNASIQVVRQTQTKVGFTCFWLRAVWERPVWKGAVSEQYEKRPLSVNWDGVEDSHAGRYFNRNSNLVLLRDWQSRGLLGKVDKELGLKLGLMVILCELCCLWKVMCVVLLVVGVKYMCCPPRPNCEKSRVVCRKRSPTTFEYSCAATAKCIIIVHWLLHWQLLSWQFWLTCAYF